MNDLTIHPIGVARTPHLTTVGSPIQPFAAKDVAGVIEVLPEYRAALADLEGFERVHLLYWFDRAKPFAPRVIPFRDTVERGLFATRAPTRPNPIGLSVVRLAGVDQAAGLVHVLDVDLLDGTPVIDIKPYVPQYDAFPGSKAGWHEQSQVERAVSDNRFEKK
jgi:tRNA-Thr(GGU) m(6)t(6)A37 methyltransferase TsaA